MKNTQRTSKPSIIAALLLVSFLAASFGADLPADARLLLEKRNKAIQQIDLKFVSELDKIKLAHAKRGDIESANAIVELIHSIAGDVEPKHLEKLAGTWKRDADGTFFEFDGRGGGMWDGRDPFTVTYDVEKRQYTIKAQTWINYLVAGSDPMTLNGIPPNPYNYVLRKTK